MNRNKNDAMRLFSWTIERTIGIGGWFVEQVQNGATVVLYFPDGEKIAVDLKKAQEIIEILELANKRNKAEKETANDE